MNKNKYLLCMFLICVCANGAAQTDDQEENEDSDISKMSKALCDFSEGRIDKSEFDNIMDGFKSKGNQGAGTHMEKSSGRDE